MKSIVNPKAMLKSVIVVLIIIFLLQFYYIKSLLGNISSIDDLIKNRQGELSVKETALLKLDSTEQAILDIQNQIESFKIKIAPYPDVPAVISDIDSILRKNLVTVINFGLGTVEKDESGIFYTDFGITIEGSYSSVINTIYDFESSEVLYTLQSTSISGIPEMADMVSMQTIVRVYFLSDTSPKNPYEEIPGDNSNPFYYNDR